MSETVIVALISLIGTLIGSLGGIVVSQRLTTYRISRLEDEVKENNKLVGRVYNLEKHNEIQDNKISHLEKEQDRIINDVKTIKAGA